MTYIARSKDAAGDVLRAADQNESVDNDDHLYAALLGPEPPASTGGMVKAWVSRTGMADGVGSIFAYITTTNEAAADGGSYHAVFEGIVVHGVGSAGENSCMGIRVQFARALNAAGAAGNNSAVVSSDTTAVAASTVATKTITTAVITVVETDEYELSVRVNIDCAGASITTAEIYGMLTVYYAGFLSAPVITGF